MSGLTKHDRAEAIVIGAGVQGMATALHLLEAGVREVRVLDRDEAFQGTSAAAAGFLGYWAMETPEFGDEEIAVERYGLQFYKDLQENGYDIDFVQNGLLVLAADARAWAEVGHYATFEAVRNEVVGAERIAELTSGTLRPAPTMKGVYHPPGAQLFSGKLGPSLVKKLEAGGGALEERRPVEGLLVRGDRIEGVRTPQGPILSDTVILAAGAWTNGLMEQHGCFLPMAPRVTSRVITEPLGLPRDLPAMFLLGLSGEPFGENFWIRRQGEALLWGGAYRVAPRDAFLEAPLPARLDDVPLDGVLHMRLLAEKAAEVIPALSRYRSMTVKHGAPCFTPDYRALVGAVAGLEGLYVIAGDCEAGVTHGPGFGKALAEFIVHGESTLASLEPWRADRFEDRFTSAAEVAQAHDEVRARRKTTKVEVS
ncbi:MAG: FAD-binding oxidoreductase [Actinobacteria bacterium]|nr:FAD-binding oxidoreductase [Actinomycetota bacterium]